MRNTKTEKTVTIEDLPEVLKVSEVQNILRVSRSKAYDIARRHKVPELGDLIRVPRSTVIRLIRGGNEAA